MDFSFLTFNSISEVVGALTVALVAVALGFRKLHSAYASDSVAIAKTNSQLDIITLLREQIQDLASANKELRVEIDSLRKLNNVLRSENYATQLEIQKLQQQVSAMRCKDCPERVFSPGPVPPSPAA